MLCPVHHNWLRVADAVSLVLEITEVVVIRFRRNSPLTPKN